MVDLPGWQEIWVDQMSTLSSSKLLSEADEVYFCTNGSVDSFLAAKQLANKHHNKIQFVHTSNTVKFMEWPTLNFLKNNIDQDNEESYVCYMHMKGVSYKPSDEITSWRKFLDHWILTNWKLCVNLLQVYETVGNSSSLKNGDKDYKIYSGNYWWAQSTYLKKLDTLVCPANLKFGTISPYTGAKYTTDNFRYDHESWVGSKDPKWGSVG